MRNILLDTNVYVAFKRNNQSVVECFRNLDYIGLDITVLAELLSGFKGGSKEKSNRRELESFLNTPRVHLLDHNYQTAEFFAQIYYNLKMKGKPVPSNDLWIAAVAMQYGLALFTLDSHFANIDGLLLKTDF